LRYRIVECQATDNGSGSRIFLAAMLCRHGVLLVMIHPVNVNLSNIDSNHQLALESASNFVAVEAGHNKLGI
jgi:hypothetical protein